MNVLETQHLSFSFRNNPVIQDVSLRIPRGSAFGFLGENGTGKSTTLRLLLGLLPPTHGTVLAFGDPIHRRAYGLHHRIGSLIEDPPLYPHLSGWDNLAVTARYRRLPDSRIREVLELVGLRAAARRRVKAYSTGMKQRLGLALALLPDPEVLVLDEPTNGLDPQGIIDVRRLIKQLHQVEGKTIVMSSHLLPEVESICTHLGVLHRRKLLFQGEIGALKVARDADELSLELTVDDVSQAAEILQSWQPSDLREETLSVRINSREQASEIIDQLRGAGISIYAVRPSEMHLEDLYLQLTHE